MAKHEDQSPMADAPHDEEAAAYARWIEAGKRSGEPEENPYPEGSPEAKAFEHGYLDGQKIRSDDKPPGNTNVGP
ncbi:Sf3a2-prov protein [Rhizobium jaguaris]|nr:Sf3a2-prov protein [Rhizobium jaguaris]